MIIQLQVLIGKMGRGGTAVASLRDYAPKKEGRGASSSDQCQVGLRTDGCTRLPIHISGGNSDGSLLCLHLLDFSNFLYFIYIPQHANIVI